MKKILFGLIGLLFAIPSFASNNLPSEYTELQYIESTGTQYIKTGLTTNNGDLFVNAVYAPTSFTTPEGYAVVFGVNNNFQAGYNAQGTANIGNASGSIKFFTLNTPATIDAVLSTSATSSLYFINGVDTKLHRLLAINQTVYLFAANNSNATKYTARGRLYKFIATRDNETIMNLVPAKNSSGMVGLYDLADSNPETAFHTNSGTGEFIAGPEVQIKIATTAYNSARFSPVVTELNDTIATIRDVVTNTINQTKAIADLQATKQTRPNETCPAGKKCLLVEDNDGTPHWYEIIENAD